MDALLIVDVQYDFMPGGALGVPEGDAIVPAIARLKRRFERVVFTQDWHPVDHCSFKQRGGIWPPHCVQNSPGARIDSRLVGREDMVVRKGIDPNIDSYSAFWDNQRLHKTELDEMLIGMGVTRAYVCGLTTDYCVKFSVVDALDAGYEAYLIEDACRGVNLVAGDDRRAVEEMVSRGARVVGEESLTRKIVT